MFARKGFTLVEILFVLIIMAGIVAYAVPSYKRAKERSRYEAALGILTNVGNAVSAFKKDLAVQYNYTDPFPASNNSYFEIPAQPDASLQLGCIQTPAEHISSYGSNATNKNKYFARYLFGLKYLEPFEPTAASGYKFYAINGNPNICSNNCKGVMACMCLSNTSGATGEFYGAKMYADGRIERFKRVLSIELK